MTARGIPGWNIRTCGSVATVGVAAGLAAASLMFGYPAGIGLLAAVLACGAVGAYLGMRGMDEATSPAEATFAKWSAVLNLAVVVAPLVALFAIWMWIVTQGNFS
jgi:hypothetical protein